MRLGVFSLGLVAVLVALNWENMNANHSLFLPCVKDGACSFRSVSAPEVKLHTSEWLISEAKLVNLRVITIRTITNFNIIEPRFSLFMDSENIFTDTSIQQKF
jgi:hypothetical protein